MANGHGGPRTPANPAAVSGPGVFSRRTDGKQPIMDLPNAAYGENAQFRSDQAGAPVPQQAPPGTAPVPPQASQSAGLGGPPLNQPPPLASGTIAPNTPVTDGAASGPGAGPEALRLQNPVQAQHESALSLIQSLASQPTASPGMRFLASSLSQGF